MLVMTSCMHPVSKKKKKKEQRPFSVLNPELLEASLKRCPKVAVKNIP